MRHRLVTAVTLFMLLCASVAPVQARPSASSPVRALPGARVEVRASHTDQRPRPVLAPTGTLTAGAGSAAVLATAEIQVTYTGFSQAAHDAFEAAVSVWETKIVSSQVIHVNAHWTPLGASTGILGSAGPHNFFVLGDGTAYPAPLAEAVCACDLSSTEIDADFNSDFGSWYLGTDGSPGQQVRLLHGRAARAGPWPGLPEQLLGGQRPGIVGFDWRWVDLPDAI